MYKKGFRIPRMIPLLAVLFLATPAAATTCSAGNYAPVATDKVIIADVRSQQLALVQYTPSTHETVVITDNSNRPCGIASSYFLYIRSATLTKNGRTMYFSHGDYVYAVDVVYKNCTKTALPMYATNPTLTHNEDGLFFYNSATNKGLVEAWYRYTFSTGATARISAKRGSSVYPIGVYPDGAGILLPGDFALYSVSLPDLRETQIAAGGVSCSGIGSADVIAFSRYTPVAYIIDVYCSKLLRFDTQTRQLTVITPLTGYALVMNVNMVLSADETFLIASIPFQDSMVSHIDVITGVRTTYSYTMPNGMTGEPNVLASWGQTSGCSVCSAYCPSPVIGQTPCPGGFHCPNSTVAVLCAVGYVCPYGSSQPAPCPVGYFCAVGGQSAGTACPAGYHCNATAAVECLAGTYCPTAVSIVPCPAGYFCVRGSAQPRECIPGRFCPPRSTTQAVCATGFYCENATVQVLCPPGSVCVEGSTAAEPCPPAFFCPVSGASAGIACASTYYCPSGTSAAVLCPAGSYCPTPDSKGQCPPGYLCPQGSLQAVVCPAEHYCPISGGSAALACAPGRYCPAGSTSQDRERPTTPAPTAPPPPETTSAPVCVPGFFLFPTGNVTAYVHDAFVNAMLRIDLGTLATTTFCQSFSDTFCGLGGSRDDAEYRISKNGRYMYTVDNLRFGRLDLVTADKIWYTAIRLFTTRLGLTVSEDAAYVLTTGVWSRYTFSSGTLEPVYTTQTYWFSDAVFLSDGATVLLADDTRVLRMNLGTMAPTVILNSFYNINRMAIASSEAFFLVSDAVALYRVDLPSLEVAVLMTHTLAALSVCMSPNDDAVYVIQDRANGPKNRLVRLDLQTLEQTNLIYAVNNYVGSPKELAIYTERACAACTLGYYCDGRTRVLCPAGMFCATPSSQAACVLGTYCPAGSVNMTLCPAGSLCPTPATRKVCPVGFHCIAGSVDAARCSLGSFCPEGSGVEGLCPAGSVCPTPSLLSTCPLGHYCGAGSTAATACDTGGSYCDEGSSAQAPCPAASFCANTSSISQCPLGSFCVAGSTAPRVCAPGSYCLPGSSVETPCSAGSYCASASSWELCPLGAVCPAGSASPEPCARGSFCPVGSSVQTPCAERYVCSTPSSQVHCEYGYDCPAGTWQAARCPPVGASCTNPVPQSPCTPGTYRSGSGRMYYFTDWYTGKIGTFDPKDGYIATACQYAAGSSVCNVPFASFSADCSKDGRLMYVVGSSWASLGSAVVNLRTMVATPIPIPPASDKQVRTWWNDSALFVYRPATASWYLYNSSWAPVLFYATDGATLGSDLVLLPDRRSVLLSDKSSFYRVDVDTLVATPVMIATNPVIFYKYCEFADGDRYVGHVFKMAISNAGSYVIFFALECHAFYTLNLTTNRTSFLYDTVDWFPDAMHFAPDDSYLLFTRIHNSEASGIYVMNLTSLAITHHLYAFGAAHPDMKLDGATRPPSALTLAMSPQAVCLPCLPREYCTGEHRALCRAGFVCNTTWSEVACLVGEYCPEGSIVAIACPEGWFCASPSNKTECVMGQFCPAGSARALSCRAGFVCNTTWSEVACLVGEFCPEGSIVAIACPEGWFCASPSNKTECVMGQLCLAGSARALPCPAGSFCPTPLRAEPCASGAYCPPGSTVQRLCPAGFVCSTPAELVECFPWQECPAGCTQAVNITSTTAPAVPVAVNTTSTTTPAVPVAAIVGGACGGAVLTAGVGGWVWVKFIRAPIALGSMFEHVKIHV